MKWSGNERRSIITEVDVSDVDCNYCKENSLLACRSATGAALF
jgi:hypothetical protein